ncbi:hypothetical protein [uncultured Enterococcus sp.]|uniref:hypothetical protein n=1 Tax=uncultured Enterococcus sp. TaxID=167972 RepID=UPI002AA91636|nr:hypothetical protein [uncultured Enterococcus sp.]
MTEQKELLEAAISEIDRVLIGNKSSDVNEIYLNNAKRFIKESMVDEVIENQKQPFEYYAVLNVIYKVAGIVGDKVEILSLHPKEGKLCKEEFYLSSAEGKPDRPATAEEIALFKRAEHFHSKGRKLNEFKKNDLVINDGDFQIVFDIGNRLYLYNICGEVIGEQDTVFLFMTAEELEAATEVN